MKHTGQNVDAETPSAKIQYFSEIYVKEENYKMEGEK